MEIKIMPKDQYGTTVFYPHCEQSKMLAELAGTKTLTPHALRIILRMGYELTYVHPCPTIL